MPGWANHSALITGNRKGRRKGDASRKARPAAGTPLRFDRALDFSVAYAAAFGWPAEWGSIGDLRDDLDWGADVLPKAAPTFGEVSEAFAWLARAIEERDPKIVFLRNKPFWGPLRADPRFDGLLRQMKRIS